MAPHAVTTSQELDTVSELTAHGIEHSLARSAPSLSTSNGTASLPLSNNLTTSTPQPSKGAETPLAELDASLLQITRTKNPRPVPAMDHPDRDGTKTCTDHMITVDWNSTTGWATPHLKPYGPLELMPTASCLHYATECFEGMKLYRGHDGKLRLFRPEKNCNRMLNSAARIALPGFPPEELLKLVEALCAEDGPQWLPKDAAGHFLYIRPTMIANEAALGVQRPKQALLFIILTCFPRMDEVPGGMKLLASKDDMCRAWPGGFGYAKVGANYGPSLVAQGEARALGFHQILWLFGEVGYVTEAGASNFFVVWRTRQEEGGRLQLVTAGLKERIVLEGVTRGSVLELAHEKLAVGTGGYEGLEELEIVERKFTIGEVEDAVQEGRMVEAFAAGTAFFVSPIGLIQFRGRNLKIPMKNETGGDYTTLLKGFLKGIMWGDKGFEGHAWGHVVAEA